MQFNRVKRGASLYPRFRFESEHQNWREDTARGANVRCSVGGYHVGFSLPKLGFESRHRKQGTDGSPHPSLMGMQCEIQLVEQSMFAQLRGQSILLLTEKSQVRSLSRTLLYINHGFKFGKFIMNRSYGEVVSFMLWEHESRVRFPIRPGTHKIVRLLTAITQKKHLQPKKAARKNNP